MVRRARCRAQHQGRGADHGGIAGRWYSGAEVSLTVGFDVWKHLHTPIKLYGEHGTILGHDPIGSAARCAGRNRTARLGRPSASAVRTPNSRNRTAGHGVRDQAWKATSPSREALALHVLEAMDKSLESAALGRALSRSRQPGTTATSIGTLRNLDRTPMKISVQIYSVRNAGDFDTAAETARAAGFDSIESVGTSPRRHSRRS